LRIPTYISPPAKMSMQSVELDPHYSIKFVSELWNVSQSYVLRVFQDRNDVMKLTKPSKNGRRARVELRIPWSTIVKVHDELCKR
jgi:hypothetical protein